MNKTQKNFMLEISLNVIFLSLGLFVAFFLLLSANRTHQENMALSNIQNHMISLSETLNSETSLSALRFDENGQITNVNPSYTLYLKKDSVNDFDWITLSLKDSDDNLITSWEVEVSR